MYIVCSNGFFEAAQWLQSRGASINTRNDAGEPSVQRLSIKKPAINITESAITK